MEPDSIQVGRDGDAWIVELVGEHDLTTAPALVDALHRVDGGGPAHVVLDLTAACFIDSSVLAALVRAGEHLDKGGGRIAVVAPVAGHPRRVLDLVGLDRPPIRIVETPVEALRLVADGA